MSEAHQVVTTGEDETPQVSRWRFMLGMAAGHAVKHCYQQGLLLLIPSVKLALGLTDVQVGLIGTARTIGASAMNLPAGIMADMWRTKVSLMLATSLTCLAIGYLLVGGAANYWMLLLGVTVTGLGTSLWHAPAFGTLAAVYPERRATALAVHRMGGSIGDSLSPVMVGIVLGGVSFWGLEWGGLGWRALAFVMVAPALLSAVAVLAAFPKGPLVSRASANFGAYLGSVRPLLTDSAVLVMVALSSVRAMAHNALNIFLIIYMDEDLGFTAFKIGYHVALLTLFGIAFAPAMGWAADRIGRRPVIFVGLTAIAMLTFGLLPFGTGASFTAILAALGLFLYSVNPVMLATAIDAGPRGTESSVTGLVFTGGAVFGAASPVIAGWLRQGYGMDAVFYYSATIVAVMAVASLFVPMRRVAS